MPHNSVTRLRLRSLFTLPAFLRETQSIVGQIASSVGFMGGGLLVEGRLVFWTRSVWTDAAAMKAFRDSGAHLVSMPKLLDWCDEASVTQWAGEAETSWDEIYARMARSGRLSRVRRPSAAHQDKRFARLRRWAPEQPIAPQIKP